MVSRNTPTLEIRKKPVRSAASTLAMVDTA
jgi:hypothetical protein